MPRVAARLRRLNAAGVEEGAMLRGWHPHARSRSFTMDMLGRNEIDRIYGAGTCGKRKGVPSLWLAVNSKRLRGSDFFSDES